MGGGGDLPVILHKVRIPYFEPCIFIFLLLELFILTIKHWFYFEVNVDAFIIIIFTKNVLAYFFKYRLFSLKRSRKSMTAPQAEKLCFTARYSKFSMIRVHFSQPVHIQAMLFYCIIFLHFSLPLLNNFKKPDSFNVSYKMDKFPFLFSNLKP